MTDAAAEAPETDLLFGTIAVKNGLATREQVDECVRVQDELASGGVRKTLGQILIERGYTDEDGIRAVLQAQGYARVRMRDMFFGRLVLRNELATPEQVMECLNAQREFQEQHGRIRRLGEIFVERGVLTAQEVRSVLTIQERMRAKGLHQSGAGGPEVRDALPIGVPADVSDVEDETYAAETDDAPRPSAARGLRVLGLLVAAVLAIFGTLLGLSEYSLRKGHALVGEGRYVEAQAVYLRPVRFGLPLRVARARCWFYAARAARAGGDRDRALEYLSTALATDPTLTDGLVDQAELFLEEGMAVAGREALRTALKQDSRHGRANYRMGLIVRAQGDPAQARYYFEQALHNASDPDFQARVQRDLDGLR